MLTHILITQFAIVEKLDLDIPEHFCVITGETGAGKSIIMDALGLTLGDRADSSMVRHGADKAEIHSTFDISHIPEARQWLQDRDLEADEQCILRRTISKDGRSKAYINGSPCTLASLKELGEILISLHGQHEHQNLLKKESHRVLLDEHGRLEKLAREVKDNYQAWKDAQNNYERLRDNAKELKDRADLLRFQLQEFEQLDLKENEYQSLELDHKRMANVESLQENGMQALTGLYEGDDTVYDRLQRLSGLVGDMLNKDSRLQETWELLDNARIQIEEASDNLSQYLNQLDSDPEQYAWVEQRLSAAYQLARKHRIDPYELTTFQRQLADELEQIGGGDEAIERLEQQAHQLKLRYLESAQKLSGKRKTAARKLRNEITRHIKSLGMPEAEFEVALHPLGPGELSAHGLESPEFQVKTNAGQPFKPLHKVASGGELSRISLSIQVACANQARVATLVFDEVDVGIGGGTAQTVGKLLRHLGEAVQVLCITHQPQVAALGHTHLHVSKRTEKQQTLTQIKQLSEQEKLMEIARMLGGAKISDQTIAHAKELIEEGS